ncbi:MAG: glycerate kinase [Bacteroidales bacterium]|nr:glycerate kinase [Bacteroidales bacterium]
MRIVIAPDSFKHSLPARTVCDAIARGIENLPGEWDIIKIPVADGGEGTVRALVDATGGAIYHQQVLDPLKREITAEFGILGDGKTAVIEMAAASGIELLKDEERNPWLTTSYGTGQLIRAALDKGCSRIIAGIGGSATNDAGLGMAMALGARFLSREGTLGEQGGGMLDQVSGIDLSELDPRIKNTEFIVACDVSNPLCGPKGASYVYGPQKGADPEMVRRLDSNLEVFAARLEAELGADIKDVPGAGAAGGLGAGLLAFCGAQLQAGFEIVARETHLDDALRNCDLVITGEGKLDAQTRYGKTPMGVVKHAKAFGLPVIAIGGTLGEGYQELYEIGFDAIFSILDKPMSLQEALITAEEMLVRTAGSVMRTWMAAR